MLKTVHDNQETYIIKIHKLHLPNGWNLHLINAPFSLSIFPFFLPAVTPRFSAGVFNPNEKVNRVDFGQTTANLGHHLENINNNP
jgi:hypothetical protein